MGIDEIILNHLFRKKGGAKKLRVSTITALSDININDIKKSIINLKDLGFIEVQDINNCLENSLIENLSELSCRISITQKGLSQKEKNRFHFSKWFIDLFKWCTSPTGIFSIISILVTILIAWLCNKETIVNITPTENKLYNNECSKPIFEDKSNNILRVIIANFTDDQAHQIGIKLNDRFKEITNNNQLIEIKYCPNLVSNMDRDSLFNILKGNNADVLIFGDFYSKEKFGENSAISYNYALIKNVLPFMNEEKHIGTPVTIKSINDVIMGKGQESYDFILLYYIALKNIVIKDFSNAISYIEKIKYNTKNPGPFIDEIYCFGQMDDHNNALKIANEGISKFPDNSELRISRAVARNALKDFEGAKIDARKAIELNKLSNQLNNQKLSVIYYVLGRAHYNYYLDLIEKSKNPYSTRFDSYQLVDSMLTYLNQAVKLNPNELNFYLEGGKACSECALSDLYIKLYKYGIENSIHKNILKEGLAIYYYHSKFSEQEISRKKELVDSAKYWDPNVEIKFANKTIRKKYLSGISSEINEDIDFNSPDFKNYEKTKEYDSLMKPYYKFIRRRTLRTKNNDFKST